MTTSAEQAWSKAERDPCDQLTAVLHAAGVKLDGAQLVAGLGALIRKPQSVTTGSLTDIVGIGRATVNHSWHQVKKTRNRTTRFNARATYSCNGARCGGPVAPPERRHESYITLHTPLRTASAALRSLLWAPRNAPALGLSAQLVISIDAAAWAWLARSRAAGRRCQVLKPCGFRCASATPVPRCLLPFRHTERTHTQNTRALFGFGRHRTAGWTSGR